MAYTTKLKLEWITGNDPAIEYGGYLGGGGFGEVHKVQILHLSSAYDIQLKNNVTKMVPVNVFP